MLPFLINIPYMYNLSYRPDSGDFVMDKESILYIPYQRRSRPELFPSPSELVLEL